LAGQGAGHEHDVSAERDSDAAHHELLRGEAEQMPDAMLFDEDEAAADLALHGAGASRDFGGSGRDHRPDPETAGASTDMQSDPTIELDAAEQSRMWGAVPAGAADDPDRTLAYGQRARSSEEDTLTAERRKPATLALAVMLAFGLLVGFAAGYAVAGRDRRTNPQDAAADAASPAVTQASPATGQRQGGGKAYSEQTLARPPAAPPVPGDGAARSALPAAAAAATTGRLVVTSTPSKAGVLVNGRWRGRTPLTLNRLKFGTYAVRVVQTGLPPARQEVKLTADDPVQSVSVRLERGASRTASAGRSAAPPPSRAPQPPASGRSAPPPAPEAAGKFAGSLYIDSRPRGARVLVDGRAAGTTPALIPDVAIGSHVVRLELADHRPWTASTRVEAGKEVRVTGSLERIP
jgi:hypothetical protein